MVMDTLASAFSGRWAGRSAGRTSGGAAGLAAILAVLACFPLGADEGTTLLRIGVFGRDPPKSFIDQSGNLAGFDVEVARALCDQARVTCELIPSDWSALLPGLVERRLDAAVASISITAERRKLVGFTRPYYTSPARWVARNGRFDPFDTAALAVLRVGVRRDTTFDRYLTDSYGTTTTIRRYATQPAALLDLLLGRIDLTLGDEITLRKSFLEAPEGSGFGFVGEPLADREWFGDGNGVAVAPGDVGLLRLLDRAVADLEADGTLRRLKARWFGIEPTAPAGGTAP